MTPNSQDWQLLREFVDNRSESAFAQLVTAHVDMVYSAALRQVRTHELAEEVTQIVFIILAKKAGKLTPGVIFPAWLHKTARFTAINILKTEARRKSYERKAAQMFSEIPEVDSNWNQLSPMLDAAIARLNERDRASIMLRYFDRKTVAEVAQAMGVSRDAAAMRISRALEKLRATFEDKGVVLGAVALGGAISANSVQAAPAGMSVAITANAIRAVGGGAAGAAAGTYNADSILHAMTIAKAKAVAMLLVAVFALAMILSLFMTHFIVPLWHEATAPVEHHTNLLNDHWQTRDRTPFCILDYRLDRRFS
jgi:RNA polymerase sigma factor (sigma-70 family)